MSPYKALLFVSSFLVISIFSIFPVMAASPTLLPSLHSSVILDGSPYVEITQALAWFDGEKLAEPDTSMANRTGILSTTTNELSRASNILEFELLDSLTTSFQDGFNSYTGTVDTFIYESNPGTARGSMNYFEWDTSGEVGSEASGRLESLLRFDNIFGSDPGQIPVGAAIISAQVEYVVFNVGDTADVYEVLVDWDENTTYNNFGAAAGVQGEDYGNYVGAASGSGFATFTIDVTESLTRWSANPTSNRGWIFRPLYADGVQVYSREASTAANRPKLIVEYTAEINLPPNPPAHLSPADSATNISTSPTLEVTVSDPDGDTMDVAFYGRSTSPASGPNFTIIALPDTQFYSGFYPDTFTAQTQWIVDNQSADNIIFVTHLGDIVQDGYDMVQWDNANAAMSVLETILIPDGLPYGMAIGTHDTDGDPSASNYNAIFGVSRFDGRSYYGGHYGSDNNNNYQLFSASGLDFIAIHLDFNDINSDHLTWADSLLKSYSNRRAIVVCHEIIGLGYPASFTYSGQLIYDALKDNPNLFLMLNGHIHGEGRREDTYESSTVYSLLSDYQDRPNGGNGWLRIYEFSPANNEIYVKTYSPTLDAFETDSDSQFTLPYDMAGSSFSMIGSISGVASGSNAVLEWPGLEAGREYEWYVVADDGIWQTSSDTWSFSTSSSPPPIADDQVVYTDEDSPQTIILTGSDPDNDPLTFSVMSSPGHGTLSGTAPSLIYTPDPDFNGSDSFTFNANDGTTNSDPATVSITVNAINDQPIAFNDSVVTVEDNPISIMLTGDDVDGDSISFYVETNPQHGTLTGTPPDLIYTPNPIYNGSDSFAFTTSDGILESEPATISIQVLPFNNQPVAYDQSISTDEDFDLPITLTADDADSDPLTFRLTSQPSFGTLTGILPDLTYHPIPNINGVDSFTFVANDGSADSNTATIIININPVNDAPTALDLSESTFADTADTWVPQVDDIDGDPLECSIIVPPVAGSTASVSSDCSSGQYTPAPGIAGPDYFTYRACDMHGACSQATVTYSILSNSMHIGDLDSISIQLPRNRWEATVIISVHDKFEEPVNNAFVQGVWSEGVVGENSCITNSSGLCQITKSNIKSNIYSAVFTINSVTYSALSYNASDNHDPDTDSDGTSIRVYKDSEPQNQPPLAQFTYNCTDLTCSFDGSASTDSDGTILTYAWNFGDGNTGSNVSTTHTYAAEGTYIVSLVVTDDAGASGSTSQQITLGSGSTPRLHVGDLDGNGDFFRKDRWSATVSIGIHSDDHVLIEGATVTGIWNTGRIMSCSTSSNGTCSITLTNIKTSDPIVTFTVTDINAPGWVYDASVNHDIDQQNDGTTITISYQ
jgi:hypothetical protein